MQSDLALPWYRILPVAAWAPSASNTSGQTIFQVKGVNGPFSQGAVRMQARCLPYSITTFREGNRAPQPPKPGLPRDDWEQADICVQDKP